MLTHICEHAEVTTLERDGADFRRQMNAKLAELAQPGRDAELMDARGMDEVLASMIELADTSAAKEADLVSRDV